MRMEAYGLKGTPTSLRGFGYTLSRTLRLTVLSLLLALIFAAIPEAATGADVQARLADDIAAGRPVVIHVVVALCDNANQGIVPVAEQLGNGQDPGTNLYWGALYGLRTHLPRKCGWSIIGTPAALDERILDRVVMFQTLKRGDADVPVFIIADGWDGAHIKQAIGAFFEITAGNKAESIKVEHEGRRYDLQAGGAARLIVYVGHNGLMEFSLPAPKPVASDHPASGAIVLACASKHYFLDHLQAVHAHPLLLTTGLMAPEAYTLDAALKAWVAGGSNEEVIEAAAAAYNSYQKCGLGPARRLFWSAPCSTPVHPSIPGLPTM
jgi:hypothetical protein